MTTAARPTFDPARGYDNDSDDDSDDRCLLKLFKLFSEDLDEQMMQ
ncbi:11832_t:CDS:2 [Funneliformis geosporum]|uniref:11832_t:CDS:1 n=1 Tax=Funneliformis geosporum TaxID=1117311 RepID=A0A9W4SKS2_9GLOM|nr:11832_t:CDS:2 [Funneliformis geosporum]